MTAALAFLVPHAVSPRRRPAANPSSQTTALRSLLPLRCVFRQRSALRPGARASRERRWRRCDRSTASSARRKLSSKSIQSLSLLRIRKLSARKSQQDTRSLQQPYQPAFTKERFASSGAERNAFTDHHYKRTHGTNSPHFN